MTAALVISEAVDEAISSHERIRSAVVNRDAAAARRAMADHLHGVLAFWADETDK